MEKDKKTIGSIKFRTGKLCRELYTAVRNFEDETGVLVRSIGLSHNFDSLTETDKLYSVYVRLDIEDSICESEMIK